MSKKRRSKPPVKLEQAKQTAALLHQVSVHQHSWRGPLPAPEYLAKFNEVAPGTAERIIKMAEQEGQHAREVEMRAIKGMLRLQHVGQVCAFVVSVLSISAAYFLTMADHDMVASILVGGSLASIVLAFLHRKKTPE